MLYVFARCCRPTLWVAIKINKSINHKDARASWTRKRERKSYHKFLENRFHTSFRHILCISTWLITPALVAIKRSCKRHASSVSILIFIGCDRRDIRCLRSWFFFLLCVNIIPELWWVRREYLHIFGLNLIENVKKTFLTYSKIKPKTSYDRGAKVSWAGCEKRCEEKITILEKQKSFAARQGKIFVVWPSDILRWQRQTGCLLLCDAFGIRISRLSRSWNWPSGIC